MYKDQSEKKKRFKNLLRYSAFLLSSQTLGCISRACDIHHAIIYTI